jgi:hypothetical protein
MLREASLGTACGTRTTTWIDRPAPDGPNAARGRLLHHGRAAVGRLWPAPVQQARRARGRLASNALTQLRIPVVTRGGM